MNLNDEKLVDTYKCYQKLYNKEPNTHKELLQFQKIVDNITRTFNISCNQIDEKILIEYNKLTVIIKRVIYDKRRRFIGRDNCKIWNRV